MLLKYGGDAASDVDWMMSELHQLRGLRRDHLKAAAVGSMVPTIMPHVIGQFLKAQPGVTFTVDVLTADQVLASLRVGDADIGVGFSLHPRSDIAVYHQVEEPFLVVMAPDHPLAALGRVTVADLTRFPLGLPSSRSGARFVFDEACSAQGWQRTRSWRRAPWSCCTGSRCLVMAQVLLRHTVGDSVERGMLRALKLGDEILGGTLQVLTLRERTLPLPSERFLAFLRDGLGAIPTPTR